MIFKYSYSILKDSDEAKDAVQEVFIKYLNSIDSFRNECNIKTWLFTITRNHCFNRLKIMNRTISDSYVEDEAVNFDFDNSITLEDALKKLPADYYELLYLKEFEGLNYKEIAISTENSIENVKIKLFRARKMLRNYFKR